ncbi:hypothetical protein OSTOST_06485 [Ostertagia ostertagi]
MDRTHVGTIDGVRREIYNEVEGEGNNAPDNIPNPSDPWSAYDDNTIIDTEDEKNLFVPKPYRPGSKEKSTTTTRPHITAPPTTIRTIPFVQTTPAPRQPIQSVQQNQFGRQPTPAAPPRFVATAPPRSVQQNQFGRQPTPAAPPRVVPTPPPRQPLPVQPQVAPQPQPHLPQQPQPLRPRTRRPPIRPPTPAPFQPQQQNFNVQQSLQTPPPQFQHLSKIDSPHSSHNNLNSKLNDHSSSHNSSKHLHRLHLHPNCRLHTIKFCSNCDGTSRAHSASSFLRRAQEASTIAHYNPTNGHCARIQSINSIRHPERTVPRLAKLALQFIEDSCVPGGDYEEDKNPKVQVTQNNVVASEPVRIFCVTCQRPRRRQNRQRNLGLRQRAKDPRQVPNSRRGAIRSHRNTRITPNRISSHPVIHGVLVRQPKAIALGVSQMSFNSPIESKTHEIAVGVSPTLYEDGGDSSTYQETRRSSGPSSKLFGVSTYQRSASDDVNSQSSLVAKQ